MSAEHLQKSKDQLMDELKAINDSQESLKKREIYKKISSIESVLGLEKRLKTGAIDKTVAEIDIKPMTAKAFDI